MRLADRFFLGERARHGPRAHNVPTKTGKPATGGHVVCAPDKFRGSLTAIDAARALADGVRDAGMVAEHCPLGDGGEGPLDALVAVGLATAVPVEARNPLGRTVQGRLGDLGDLGDGHRLVEAAEAIALGELDPEQRDPRRTLQARRSPPRL